MDFKLVRKVLKEGFKSFGEDKITKLSASLAYYTVFSMGPLLVMIIAICSLLLQREDVEGTIFSQLSGFVGEDTAAELRGIIEKASLAGKSTVAAIIGGGALLLGATTVFAEIQDSINSIWELKAKPKQGLWAMVRNRLLSFSVVISLGFLLLVSLAFSAIIDALSDNLKDRFPDVTVVAFYIVNLILTFIITTLLFAVIFKVLPDAKIRWKEVIPGAMATSVLFMIGKLAISLYISKANIGNTYGAAGSLVILLVWVYYSSIILYFGAALTKAWVTRTGARIEPKKYAVETKEVALK